MHDLEPDVSAPSREEPPTGQPPQASSHPSGVPFAWWEALVGILLFVLLGEILSLLISGARAGLHELSDDVSFKELFTHFASDSGTALLAAALAQCLVVAYVFLRIRMKRARTGFERMGFNFNVPDLALALCAPLALLPLVALVVLGFFIEQPQAPENVRMVELITRTSPRELILFLFIGVLIAPFCEETLFRGFIYPIAARYFRRHVAVWLVAGVFVAMHVAQTGGFWLTIVMVGTVSLVLTYLRAYSGSVVPCWFTHSIYNAILITPLIPVQTMREFVEPQALAYYLNLLAPLMPSDPMRLLTSVSAMIL